MTKVPWEIPSTEPAPTIGRDWEAVGVCTGPRVQGMLWSIALAMVEERVRENAV